MLTRNAIPARSHSVACRASAVADRVIIPRASTIVLEDVPVCPCVAAVDVFAAKDKCIHPTRPVKDACPDCPRRKGRASVQTEAAPPTSNVLEVYAAKDKCVHPSRPLKDACPDCPRRKGRSAVATQEALPCAAIQEARPTKCVHPYRPLSASCRDCPRLKRRFTAGVDAVQEKAMPVMPAGGVNLRVFAAKDKCVHPTRPVKDACPDCPRRRR